jgi:hypothetical protein
MPVSIDEYFRLLLDQIAACAPVRSSDLNFDQRSSMVGFVRGEIFFSDDSLLHVRELIDLRKRSSRVMYVYHYKSSNGELIFRFDNTAHHRELATFPHHKHVPTGVEPVPGEPPSLAEVLAQIEATIQIA